MESLNLASKLYKTDFFRMKCSTQDSSTKRSKTMTNQRVSKQVVVSISMLKKRTFQSVFRTKKNRQKSVL